MIITFLFGIAVFSISVIIHAIFMRVFGEKQFMFLGLVFGFLVLAGFNLHHPAMDSLPFFSLIFSLLWLMYLYFIGCLTRSISIYIISQIVHHGSAKFKKENISDLYDEKESSLVRLKAMEENGLLVIKDGETVEITPKGKILCFAFSLVRKIFRTEVVG